MELAITDAKARLTDLVRRAEAGEEVVIARHGHAVAEACSSWGKGKHPAGLNFGDCFAYVTAKSGGAP